MITYSDYPQQVIEDIVRLRRRLDAREIPTRRTDYNFIVGSWNIRAFGPVHPEWTENPGTPKRNLRALAIIAEVIRRFDVVAIQEVNRNSSGLRLLVDEFLGPDWRVMLSDTTAGAKGNSERLAYLYDSRRVTPSGLVGEIVLPPAPEGTPVEQFDRTPYLVGFQARAERFTLLTAHIRYGESPEVRTPELRAIADYTAREIRDRSRGGGLEESNLIVLGDFNIDRRQGNPLFDAFVSQGLWVPTPLQDARTTTGQVAKHYDQIAWFRDDLQLATQGRAGTVDFLGTVFKELSTLQLSYRISDHFPLWVEFLTDRSVEAMAIGLGINPANPEPFAGIPD